MNTRGLAIVVSAFVVLGGCGSSENTASGATQTAPSVLEQAHTRCVADFEKLLKKNGFDDDTTPGKWISLGDDGATVTVQSPKPGDIGAMLSGFLGNCVLNEAGAPDSVLNELNSTTGVMGRQTGTWDDFEVSYSFTPDSGLALTVTQAP